MRLKYDSAKDVPFLQNKCGWLGLGEWKPTEAGGVEWEWHNTYETTIHAVNSLVVKTSRLTKIAPLYRGWTGATLPRSFFEPDALGLCGGVECAAPTSPPLCGEP